MRLKPFNPKKELKKLKRDCKIRYLIISLFLLIIMISIGRSYAIFSINPQSHIIINSKVGEFSIGDIKFSIIVDGALQNEFPSKDSGYIYEKTECTNGSIGNWDINSWQLSLNAKGKDKCIISFISVKGLKLTELLLLQYKEGADVGLLKDETNPNLYYYKGTHADVDNNFLWYGGHQWRVLDFDNNKKTVTLITQQPLTNIYPANSVWTTESEYNSSYINTWLNDYFWNGLDNNIQRNIIDTTFNIGIEDNVDEITTTKKVGLLDYDQFLRCGGSKSFLNMNDYMWFGNRHSQSGISSISYMGYSNPSSSAFGVRPIIKIADIVISSGIGTLDNSFNSSVKATDTSNVQIGEYIDVPYNGNDNACGSDKLCTMRVVSKNANSIKVVLNGLLPTKSVWADSASDNITTSDTVYTNVLNSFVANIDSKYITTGTYGVGMYASGNSYSVPASTTISANVGLPTVGEMFSGNDIDISRSNSKKFVDVSTIENPTISIDYWTMNRYDSSRVIYVEGDGDLSSSNPSSSYGVRAVFYLKSGTSALTFTGGEGTPQSPYTLN